MTKVRTGELSGQALNWAVADMLHIPIVVVDGVVHDYILREMGVDGSTEYNPATNWALGGPILERAKVDVKAPRPVWGWYVAYVPIFSTGLMEESGYCFGSTMLEAGLRACVRHAVGDYVEVPEELHETPRRTQPEDVCRVAEKRHAARAGVGGKT